MKKIFYSIIALATVAFSLASCSDIPAPYDIPQSKTTETIAPAGDGTLENPYNVAAIDSILDSGFSTEDDANNPYYYIKGIISSRPSITTSYGNGTYYISDDGTSDNQFYIYRSYSYNGDKFTSTDDLQYGDTVVVYTQVYSYSGTYETRSGVCQLVSRNGTQKGGGGGGSSSSAEAKGSGTEADPYNVAGVLAYINTLGANIESDKEVYVKGVVLENSTTDATITSYGNMTFTMIDEGYENATFTAFQVYGPGKQKFTSASQIKKGQTVVVCGKVLSYKGNTPETVSKGAAYVVSIEGEGSGGGDTPSTGAGTKDNPYSVAAAISAISALESGGTTSSEIYVSGKVSQIGKLGSSGQLIYYISDDGSTTNQLEIYYGNYLGNVAFTSADQIKVGDAVVVCGTATNYKGNTPEFASGKSYIYSLNGKTSDQGGSEEQASAGITIDGTTVTCSAGVAAGSNSVTMVVNDLGLADKASAIGTYKFSDGATLTIAQGDGKSGPTYYTASNGFRIYASNTLTFEGTATIAKIVMECDSYNGTNYVGNTTATFTASGKTATYNNYIAANSGGTQLRVKTITIYYAASAAKRFARRR